jgi:HD-GYP domain-containing protein (c-di-GMP phosphodiesterase class II)
MIESHVHKGVELLESLSSFEEQVILSVRHHHERYDGKGYPDGVSGKDIPIGGRIIKICDAIDAMLSDRPYRKALELPVVRQELLVHSGTQFDPDIVERLLATDYLEQHADEVSAGSHRFKLRAPRPVTERPKVRVVK